ncbi:bifunctional UDP-N-acetylglucosamine transferase and deubiquitinase ALG13 [Trichonephila clavata]|uniref:Bifunctional UDP-N-acetylglucosamine transferase and deubiquitinase ALG13 n=1 Tax=Trichonephila clavata TaxID=2740835 RepID=A0A8X6JKT0_TRICU|nr:bifunctional UDP-N-acetylglucosamine transferase and deubiquitinase ALG13 [Trichonephila clavata]
MRKENRVKNEQFVIPKLEPGVKCKVYVNKDKEICYARRVQEAFDDSETVSIYIIEDLCKKCIVPTSVLEIFLIPAYKSYGEPQAVDVQALKWQGGKTYKVFSDCMQGGSDAEKDKPKKILKKLQNHFPIHNGGNNPVKPNIIARSNSLPASSSQRNTVVHSNGMYSSSQMTRKKGHKSNTPFNNKPKYILQKDSRNEQVIRPP